MRAILLPNGNLLVPVEAGPADDTGAEPFREISPEHPEYGHWLALAEPGQDPRQGPAGGGPPWRLPEMWDQLYGNQ
jgi:hypothetical protein